MGKCQEIYCEQKAQIICSCCHKYICKRHEYKLYLPGIPSNETYCYSCWEAKWEPYKQPV